MSILQPKPFVVIEQRIAAAHDWDGTVPTTDPVTEDGIKAYPESNAGGLFVFDFASFFLMEIQQINVHWNGVANKSIYIRRPGGPDVTIYKSTSAGETDVVIADGFQLARDEQIAIVSSAAATAMYARVIGRALHPAPFSMVS